MFFSLALSFFQFPGFTKPIYGIVRLGSQNLACQWLFCSTWRWFGSGEWRHWHSSLCSTSHPWMVATCGCYFLLVSTVGIWILNSSVIECSFFKPNLLSFKLESEPLYLYSCNTSPQPWFFERLFLGFFIEVYFYF